MCFLAFRFYTARLFLALLCCRSCCCCSSFFFSSIECHMCRSGKKKVYLCNQFSSHCDCTVPRYTRFTVCTRTHRTHFIRCSCRRNRRENRSVELLFNTRIQFCRNRKAFSGEKKCISKPHKLHAREAQQNTTPRKNSHRDILPQKCPSSTTA